MSARDLDLVHEVETENSLEGSPTTKHLSLDIEPPLKEFYLNQWSEPRRSWTRNTGEAASWGQGCVEVGGPVQCQRTCGVCPWASKSDVREVGAIGEWIVIGQEQVPETRICYLRFRASASLGEQKTRLQPTHPPAGCFEQGTT